MKTSLAMPQTPFPEHLRENKKGGPRKRLPKAMTIDDLEEKQWGAFLAQVQGGVKVIVALKTCGMTSSMLESVIRSNKKYFQAYEDAKLAAVRIGWDPDMIEDILVAVSMGSTLTAALEAKGKKTTTQQASFYKLLLKDPVVKEAYDEARMIQAEKMAIDDIIEISDDMSGDETFDGKPNSARVNRDKLRTDSRKWIASKLHYKRFGDKIQQDVNAHLVVDHAARLEAARKRREQAHSDSAPQRVEKEINPI